MPNNTRFVPEGYHSVTPYLIVKGAAEAIEFYKKAFGAVEVLRIPGPGGSVGHAEIKIGDSHVMLADEHPDMGYRGPKALGGSPVSLMIYVPDVDNRVRVAAEAGARITQPVQDKFYGDRNGQLEDPFGHVWTISTHIEDVSLAEIELRLKKMMGG